MTNGWYCWLIVTQSLRFRLRQTWELSGSDGQTEYIFLSNCSNFACSERTGWWTFQIYCGRCALLVHKTQSLSLHLRQWRQPITDDATTFAEDNQSVVKKYTFIYNIKGYLLTYLLTFDEAVNHWTFKNFFMTRHESHLNVHVLSTVTNSNSNTCSNICRYLPVKYTVAVNSREASIILTALKGLTTASRRGTV